MANRFVYRPQVEKEIARRLDSELRKRAERIADETRTQARMASVGARYEPIVVTSDDGKATVAAQGPFAHIDEWGSINSAPTAAMRRAAARAGRFEES